MISKSTIIIPARYEATRFPGKLLKDLGGKPVLKWVYDALKEHLIVGNLIIATDSDLIAEQAKYWGANVFRSQQIHLNGTSRCAEWASLDHDSEIIINVQGDEPFVKYAAVKKLIDCLQQNEHQEIVTLAKPSKSLDEVKDPARVKLVKDINHRALYFSRSVIPCEQEALVDSKYWIHQGIYGFRRKTLLALMDLEKSELDQREKLEQLRWMYHGFNVMVLESNYSSISIDTPTDLEVAQKMLLKD